MSAETETVQFEPMEVDVNTSDNKTNHDHSNCNEHEHDHDHSHHNEDNNDNEEEEEEKLSLSEFYYAEHQEITLLHNHLKELPDFSGYTEIRRLILRQNLLTNLN
eukprot:242353_1